MFSLPVKGGTVVVVCVGVMIMGVHPRQEGTSGGAAHGSGDERVVEMYTLITHDS